MKRKSRVLLRRRLLSRCSAVIFMCVAMSICLFPLRSYASTSVPSGYKPTAELTDKDRLDEHQKNFQESHGDGEKCHLYKTAEWTNKQTGDAKIVLSGSVKDLKETRSAVYAFNVCESHGFSREIAKRNIDFLLQNFGRVDVVRTGVTDDETIYTKEDVKSFDDVQWPSLAAGQDRITGSHRSIGLYDGLRNYLKKVSHRPTHIYVSFDMFYAADVLMKKDNAELVLKKDETTGIERVELASPSVTRAPGATTVSGVPETMDDDCFETLKSYKKAGRYFSMAADYDGKPITKDKGTYVIYGGPEELVVAQEKPQKLGRERFFYSANIIAALADPNVWPGREAAKKGFWNGEAYNPVNPADSQFPGTHSIARKAQGFKGVAPDYLYDKDFKDIFNLKCSLRIQDVVSDVFEITKVTSEGPKAVVKVEGNSVSVRAEDCDGKEPLVVTIEARLKNQREGVKGRWIDTNKGLMSVWFDEGEGEKECCSVGSPKLFVDDPSKVVVPPPPSGPDKEIVPPKPKQPGSCTCTCTCVCIPPSGTDPSKTVIPPSTVTVTVPPSNVTVTVPPSNVTVTVPPSNVTVTVPPSNVTVTVPPINVNVVVNIPPGVVAPPKTPETPKQPETPKTPKTPKTPETLVCGCGPCMPVCDPCMPMWDPCMPMWDPCMPMAFCC